MSIFTGYKTRHEREKENLQTLPVSGFPEWLPEVRIVEQQWLDHIRRVFESYGFCSIETPAVEELNVIGAKGEDVDKEIYVIERLHKDENDTSEARLALHFDQTVPFARYVASISTIWCFRSNATRCKKSGAARDRKQAACASSINAIST